MLKFMQQLFFRTSEKGSEREALIHKQKKEAKPNTTELKNQNETFIIAAKKGDIETLESLLKLGVHQINYGEESLGEYASRQAVLYNKTDALELLLSYGINIDKVTDNKSILSVAFNNELPAMVDLILKRGADINTLVQRKGDQSLLHQASGKGYTSLVKTLLKDPEHKKKINEADSYGMTPLLAAALRNHHEIIEILVKNGANVKHKNNRGNTVLHSLCSDSSGLTSVPFLLEHGASMDVENEEGETPLSRLESIEEKNRIKDMLLQRVRNSFSVVASSKKEIDTSVETGLGLSNIRP